MVNTRNQGDRHERECKDILTANGFWPHKKVNNAYDNGDILQLFDLVALKPGYKPRFIQVKTGYSGGWLKKLASFTDQLPETITVELWHRFKGHNGGWWIRRYNWQTGEFETILDERDTDNNIGELAEHEYVEEELENQ